MIDIDEQKKIAVLIDADNTPVNKLRSIIQEVAVYGHVGIRRLFPGHPKELEEGA